MNAFFTEANKGNEGTGASVASPASAQPGFDRVLAAWLCGFSKAAYTNNPQGEVIERAESETRAVCVVDGDAIVCAFRGTEDLRNWLTDLDVFQTGYPMLDYGAGRVHLGFWRAWTSIRGPLWEWLKAHAEARTRTVYFTGHSLGGALAMLAAHRFHLDFGSGPITYTFGQPRVGNAGFAGAFNRDLLASTWRVAHAADVVPHLPFPFAILPFPLSYRHAGQEVFYRDAADAAVAASEQRRPVGEDYVINPKFADKLPWDIRNGIREFWHGQIALLEDHHVNNYLALFR